MSKLKVYYSVENGGDGSAHPIFFTDKDVAEFHQDNLDEGWGEPCTGDITFEGDNLCCPEATTKEGYYLQLLLDYWGDGDNDILKQFSDQFFKESLPKFDVNILDEKHYGILFEGKVIYKSFAWIQKIEKAVTSEKGRLALKIKVNEK